MIITMSIFTEIRSYVFFWNISKGDVTAFDWPTETGVDNVSDTIWCH